MELRQLRYFTRIVDIGSMSRAAETLFIAQSALSQQVAKLESELGCSLLRRSSRGVEMTQAGERVYRHAQQILSHVDELRRDLLGASEQPRGRVTVGMPSSISQLCTTPLIALGWKTLPDVLLNVQEATSALLPQQLLHGRFDLAVLFAEDLVKGIDATRLFEDSLYLVERNTDKGGGADCTVAIHALQGRSLAMTPLGNNVRRMVDGACEVLDVHYRLVAEASSPQTILRAVRLGDVATVCPWSALSGWVGDPHLAIRRIVDPPLARTVMLASAADRPLTEAAAAVRAAFIGLVPLLVPQTPGP